MIFLFEIASLASQILVDTKRCSRDGAGISFSTQVRWEAREGRRPTGTEDSRRTRARRWRAAGGIAGAAAVQRHTVVHIVDVSLFVRILHVPLTEGQLMEFMEMFDTVTPGQVIAVPKISCPLRPLRAVPQ